MDRRTWPASLQPPTSPDLPPPPSPSPSPQPQSLLSEAVEEFIGMGSSPAEQMIRNMVRRPGPGLPPLGRPLMLSTARRRRVWADGWGSPL